MYQGGLSEYVDPNLRVTVLQFGTAGRDVVMFRHIGREAAYIIV